MGKKMCSEAFICQEKKPPVTMTTCLLSQIVSSNLIGRDSRERSWQNGYMFSLRVHLQPDRHCLLCSCLCADFTHTYTHSGSTHTLTRVETNGGGPLSRPLEVDIRNVAWKISGYTPYTCVYPPLHYWAWPILRCWKPASGFPISVAMLPSCGHVKLLQFICSVLLRLWLCVDIAA